MIPADPLRNLGPATQQEICGAWVGPIWKLDGETCICVEPPGHLVIDVGKPGAGHRCSCGTWFCEEVAHYG